MYVYQLADRCPPLSQVLGRTKEYIVAEHPLPDMIEEYWSMVLERSISTIVILGPILDDDVCVGAGALADQTDCLFAGYLLAH